MTKPKDDRITEDGFAVIEREEDVPVFTDEDEEDQYWSTHAESDAVLAEYRPARHVDPGLPPPRPRSAPISLRLDSDVLYRLRRLAAKKHMPYQALLKQFVVERLYEEEKREQVIF